MAVMEWTFVQAIAGPYGPTFSNCNDASILEAYPTTNTGSQVTMRVDSASSAAINLWICFDIYGIIPTNSTVLDCRLQMTVSSVPSNNAGGALVYRCLKNPTESQVTWNAVDSGLNWNTAGGRGESSTEDDNDDNAKADRRYGGAGTFYTWLYAGGTGLTTIIPLANTWFKSVVQGWIDGSIESSRGLILDGQTHVSSPVIDCTFHSSEATNAANRPRLYVQYRVPSSFGIGRVNTWNRVDGLRGRVN